MKRVRPASFLFLALVAASGCRTAGLDNLVRPNPVEPRASIDVHDVIVEHNRNAELIQSLEARPSIAITLGRQHGGVEGKLAMERPRNFKLDLSAHTSSVADIGSNDAEFWFWVKSNDAKDRAVYYCNYDESGTSPLTSTMQPDWIVESLGLRVIPEDEEKDITATPGKDPDTLILTHRPTKVGGESVVRVTLVSKSTRRIKAHELWTGDQKTKLAQAVIQSYQKVEDGAGEKAVIPHKLRLDWYREKIAMDVTIPQATTTKVNPQFTQARRDALFIEPSPPGCARKNLAELSGPSTTIRETRPAPPAGTASGAARPATGVQLGEPTPVDRAGDSDDADTPREGAARPTRGPIALSADLPSLPRLADDLVDPPAPKPPDPEGLNVSGTTWKSVNRLGYER